MIFISPKGGRLENIVPQCGGQAEKKIPQKKEGKYEEVIVCHVRNFMGS